jgi:glucose-6-phosphate 1-dehydrogenase
MSNQQCDFVIFGGSGDLAFRKLYPALLSLFQNGLLTPADRIIAVARSEANNDSFRLQLREALQDGAHGHIDEPVLEQFLACVWFQHCNLSADADWQKLSDLLLGIGPRLRLFYIATPPSVFVSITDKIGAFGLSAGDARLIVEKPLGMDLASGRLINQAMLAAFDENRIYRIDHYLGKETVQNLLALRFGNSFLEQLWNGNFIDHVQISVTETIGVEGRGAFYEETGALRDMVQNHMLQMLAFVAMEHPFSLAAEDIRDEKVRVLRALSPGGEGDQTSIIAGQYDSGTVVEKNGGEKTVPDYRSEVRNGQAETFVAIRTFVQNQRWGGVPFYLRTGKRTREQTATIIIQFKPLAHSVFSRSGHALQEPNRLIIKLQPEEWIRLTIATKARTTDALQLEPTSLDLHLDRRKTARSYSAYERLLASALRGDQTLFVRQDEVEASWRWIDSVRDLWRRAGHPLFPYPAGSWGPVNADELIRRDGREWLSY